ncbi:MAG: serine/threonine-protein phosphatase [Clostridia bacterium]|nr:serine/threonine-protein phosphatase [Clostridia bacterium]
MFNFGKKKRKEKNNIGQPLGEESKQGINLEEAVNSIPLTLASDDDDSIESTIAIRSGAEFLQVGSATCVGSREYQQDSLKVTKDFIEHIGKENLAIAILCDGMGGLKGGDLASNLCTSTIFNDFYSREEITNYNKYLIRQIYKVDDMVCSLVDENNNRMRCGSTLTAVIVDEDEMYWASVGDSRIYLIRNGEALQLTQDHNYLMKLMQDVKDGRITEAEALSHPDKGALISFIGMGGVKHICSNSRPIKLCKGDYIVLCSDGLYRCLSDNAMVQILNESSDDMIVAANRLVYSALSTNMKSHDNTSVIVIKYI